MTYDSDIIGCCNILLWNSVGLGFWYAYMFLHRRSLGWFHSETIGDSSESEIVLIFVSINTII